MSQKFQIICSGSPLSITVELKSKQKANAVILYIALVDLHGTRLFALTNKVTCTAINIESGINIIFCDLPKLPLPAGKYRIDAAIIMGNSLQDRIEGISYITVEDYGDFFDGNSQEAQESPVLVEQSWKLLS